MRERAKARIIWIVVGFVLGWVTSVLYWSLQMWGFEDRALFKWVRWMGKETIKWSYIALIVAVIVFVLVQLFNIFVANRELTKKDDQQK